MGGAAGLPQLSQVILSQSQDAVTSVRIPKNPGSELVPLNIRTG